jgi:hypothetical protein
VPALAAAVDWLFSAGTWVTVGAALVTVWVRELTTDPRVPVIGSVTVWTAPETPDVSPESKDGWGSFAARACVAVSVAGSDRSTQIPPLAIANLATRSATRRVLGFDIDNSQSPGNSRLPFGCLAAGH